MRNKILASVTLVTLAVGSLAFAAASRDYISIVGSSTVYPFATVVAERFGKTTDFKTPKIESTGSGGGIKLFCAGGGLDTPDIANSSRRIKPAEVDTCAKNGVKEITEIKIGYDGIALANSKKAPRLSISRKELFLALAAQGPDPKGGKELVPNPYKLWSDINWVLPEAKIEVLGPPPTSGTRDAFVELVMEVGCKQFDVIAALEQPNPAAFKRACQTMREDGAFIEAGENDNLIVQKLQANPNAFGIFGYSFLEQNTDKVQGAVIEGAEPTFEAIADGKYPVSRPLYMYIKKSHVKRVPGIREYIGEFTSEKACGPEGYLAEKGLIPMPDAEREKVRNDAQDLVALKL